MRKFRLSKFILLICIVFAMISGLFAQENSLKEIKSQEVSEEDGIPVLVKHLPDWENVRNGAIYILNTDDLRKALGDRPVLEPIDFELGAEAVTANYEAGKLLIIEYSTPQGSVDADKRIKQKLSEEQNPQTFYRRIGNYNAFVFDATDEKSAKALLDQIKYEKKIQWLGYNPFAVQQAQKEASKAERTFVLQTADLFFATVQVIVSGLGLSVILGLIVGVMFFFKREKQRATMETYTDAGGMTRLNLDGFTPEIPIDRLLKD